VTTERSPVCSDAVGAFADAIREEGFVFVAGAQLRAALGGPPALGDFPAFAASWNDLALDTHLPEGHRYRRRRHGTFSAGAGHGSFDREPHAPHYQAREYNKLVGGIERWFEPIAPQVASGATFTRVVGMGSSCMARSRPAPIGISRRTNSVSRPARTRSGCRRRKACTATASIT
jgi:hypothetical protein